MSYQSLSRRPHENENVSVYLMTFMFLTVGIMFCMNDILLPVVKDKFHFSYLQATSIQASFYVVYLVWPFLISHAIGRFGYRKNIIAAMIICLVGCLLFVPADVLSSFSLILCAVFIISSGIAIINVAANPYVALLGNPAGATMRLNFVQAFSRIGYAITPLAASRLIYGGSGIPNIFIPYVSLSILIFVVVVSLTFIHMPDHTPASSSNMSFFEILKQIRGHRQLLYGLPVMFFYVGAEACTSGFFISYMTAHSFTEIQAAGFLTFYYVLAALCALGGSFLLRVISAGGLLALFGTGMVFCYIITIAGPHGIAPYSLIAAGGFLSVLFPTIFGLAIENLGDLTAKGSAVLNVAIVGGAFFPPIQGMIADWAGINVSYLVPAICVVVVSIYGYSIRFSVKYVE